MRPPRFTSKVKVLSLASLLSLSSISAQAVPDSALYRERIWTSADGRTLTATLLAVDSTAQTVSLRRTDGTEFTITWQQLSQEDATRLKTEQAATATTTTNAPLPESFELRDVPMVQQKGNYCVPASAAMIAGFHGLKTDQDEIAQLSSEASVSNQGTYPADMLLAMEKLGFTGQRRHWERADFTDQVLPEIRKALLNRGPIYLSFRSGVFGKMGHGCVIIGYNDRRQELTLHNPWGELMTRTYEEVARDAYGVVFIDPPQTAPIASDAFIESMKQQVPHFKGNILAVSQQLTAAQIPHELLWCSRRDAREDSRFAQDTARRDGRKILELAFERNPAVLIPYSPKGETESYYFVTRPPEGGARFMVWEINQNGWKAPALKTLGSLTRNWATRFSIANSPDSVWELPMIELTEGR